MAAVNTVTISGFPHKFSNRLKPFLKTNELIAFVYAVSC